jgi:hypothetical protein
MPLKKFQPRPGVNKENTRYANENGWYDSDKVRFRQGTPEKIGGWVRISTNTFLGVCRSLWNWVTLAGQNLIGVGTNLKFYIENGGAYFDITPLRYTASAGVTTFTGNGTTTVTVNAASHGAITGDFVTFSGVTGTYTTLLNAEYQVTVVNSNSYTITTSSAVASGATGGSAVVAKYQIAVGAAIQAPLSGWGAGLWNAGYWGIGTGDTNYSLRLWTQTNFGPDLIFGYRGGSMYYWDAANGVTTRGVLLSSLTGASDVPTVQNITFVSDNRFVFAFGCNDYGSVTQNPMLFRWSDQENPVNWTVSATSQAGSLTLSHGSEITTVVQTRQEMVVFTDSAVYSLQYLGLPAVWGAQILGDNISIISPNAAVVASGRVFWMGVDKFYVYDGRVNTLNCDLRKYIYQDINLNQKQQVFCSTNEGFNEVWWFYCSENSTTVDRYVVYNYVENDGKGGIGVWYNGSMARTAWLDSGLTDYPVAATYSYNLVNHELGVDDNETGNVAPIFSYVSSSEFDIDDGDRFGFIWRVLPDVTFEGSTVDTPTVTMTLLPMQNSGSGYNDPPSVAGRNDGDVTLNKYQILIERFTGQINVRIRGRQMVFRIQSSDLGVFWQLGHPRFDIRLDGRR